MDTSTQTGKNWNKAEADVFWNNIATCDHVVQIYEDEVLLLNMLAAFVAGGKKIGDCSVIIATQSHLRLIEEKLLSKNIRVDDLISDQLYIPLDAEETLAEFMVDGWPDEKLFRQTILPVLNIGFGSGRPVRAFGEMVAILWAQGLNTATIHLEFLWNKLRKEKEFSLFCAYPHTIFSPGSRHSVMEVCSCHNITITGSDKSENEILYAIA